MPGDQFRNPEGKRAAFLTEAVIKAILEDTESKHTSIGEFPDRITLDTKHEILKLYLKRVEVAGEESFYTFVEIGEKLFPNSIYISKYSVNTIKSIVSRVAQHMYHKLVLRRLVEGDLIMDSFRISNETIEECAMRLTEKFQSDRSSRTTTIGQIKLQQENPELTIRTLIKKNYKHGNINWTVEKIEYLKQLVEATLWPKGHPHGGQPNWGAIAEVFSTQVTVKRNNLAKKLRDAWSMYKDNPPTITEAYVAEVLGEES